MSTGQTVTNRDLGAHSRADCAQLRRETQCVLRGRLAASTAGGFHARQIERLLAYHLLVDNDIAREKAKEATFGTQLKQYWDVQGIHRKCDMRII